MRTPRGHRLPSHERIGLGYTRRTPAVKMDLSGRLRPRSRERRSPLSSCGKGPEHGSGAIPPLASRQLERGRGSPRNWFPRSSSRSFAAPTAYAPTTQASASASQSSKASPKHTTGLSPSAPEPTAGSASPCNYPPRHRTRPGTAKQSARHKSTPARRDEWILDGAQRSQPQAIERERLEEMLH